MLFAREGAKVLLVDINADHAQETLELITAEGGEASVFQADVTNAGPLPVHGRVGGRAVRQARHPR